MTFCQSGNNTRVGDTDLLHGHTSISPSEGLQQELYQKYARLESIERRLVSFNDASVIPVQVISLAAGVKLFSDKLAAFTGVIHLVSIYLLSFLEI